MSRELPHVAVWSPMPPAATGIAKYSFDLLNSLKSDLRISVVVPPCDVDRAIIPEGVGLLSSVEALQGHIGQPELHIYNVGNHFRFHGWMLEPLHRNPGIVVLHDVSLYDLYRELCSESGTLWQKAIAQEGYDELLSTRLEVDEHGSTAPDRIAYNFTGEVVEKSLCTVVHSQWALDFLQTLHPRARIVRIPLAAPSLEDDDTRGHSGLSGPTIAILGGINHHKRVDIALRGFARAIEGRSEAKLLLVGRSDQPSLVSSLRQLIKDLGIEAQTDLLVDVSSDEFDQVLKDAHLVVTLRWPTAGETSAVLMQALGAGRPVLTSDVPQFAEYDERFVFRVTPGSPHEIDDVAVIMRDVIEHPEQFRKIGELARNYIRSHATLDIVAGAYTDLVRDQLKIQNVLAREQTESATTTAMVPGARPAAVETLGLTIHGDWTATTGLAQAGRRLGVGLLHAGIPLAIRTVSSKQPTQPSLFPAELLHLQEHPERPIDLWTLNINEFHLVSDEALRSPRTHRYQIATWYWELPTIPEWLQTEIPRVDEIWAPTRFVQRALGRYSAKPIHIVPTIVPTFRADRDRDALRSQFDLRGDAPVFLFTFDCNSSIARKNPLGVVEAFARAFPGRGPDAPTLILKTINLERYPGFERNLRECMATVNGTVLNRHLSQQEMANLIHACDVYVSLHRSEGFGLGLAEAMAIGKPVIGTGYSGNIDFMNVVNSCLVGYRLRTINKNDFEDAPGMSSVYTEGTLWAEPDLDQAAEWMQILASDETLRNRIGASAKAAIASSFSEEVVGRTAVARLTTLADELRG